MNGRPAKKVKFLLSCAKYAGAGLCAAMLAYFLLSVWGAMNRMEKAAGGKTPPQKPKPGRVLQTM
ncbi:MAG: hypothetical protein PHW69_00425 [Elusimicrobiaceae bacterium]|nr:hypothetical protein [Elusimicrobiaceae bacterium]